MLNSYSVRGAMEKLLIVEDEPAVAEMLGDLLQMAGFHVTKAADGEEGLSLLQSTGFHGILLDIMLPKRDGFELCREARKLTDVPVIFVTARKDEIDKVRAFSLGADDYITKPFSGTELVARVRGHLSRYAALTGKDHPGKGGELLLRGLKVDPAGSTVTLKGRTCSLSHIEMKLLLVLCRHPNHTFTKQELFQAVWTDEVGDENAVSVYMRRLREKIEEDPKSPEYLRTAWGQGYFLRV